MRICGIAITNQNPQQQKTTTTIVKIRTTTMNNPTAPLKTNVSSAKVRRLPGTLLHQKSSASNTSPHLLRRCHGLSTSSRKDCLPLADRSYVLPLPVKKQADNEMLAPMAQEHHGTQTPPHFPKWPNRYSNAVALCCRVTLRRNTFSRIWVSQENRATPPQRAL